MKLTSRKWCNKVYRKCTKLGSTLTCPGIGDTFLAQWAANALGLQCCSGRFRCAYVAASGVDPRYENSNGWRVTLQELNSWRQAPGSLGRSYGTGDTEVRVSGTQINMGAQWSNLDVGMPSTPDQSELSHVTMKRNSRLLSEPVTAPTNVTFTVGARASAASIPVARNFPMEAPVSVIPDTPLPLHASTDTLQCVSSASASTPTVVMQTGQETVACAQASVVSVPSIHQSEPAVTQINDDMAQTNPAVPGLKLTVFPVLP